MRETAVTIRERALEALAAAGPEGLTISVLAAAVSGPWQQAAVRAVVRKLWAAGELARREDATFVQSGRRAHDIRYRIEREAAAEQRLAAAVRRVVTAAGERSATPLRTSKIDPALLKAFYPTCREIVFPRLDGRCTGRGTQTGTNLKAICERDQELAA
jgi:hypothetical protein